MPVVEFWSALSLQVQCCRVARLRHTPDLLSSIGSLRATRVRLPKDVLSLNLFSNPRVQRGGRQFLGLSPEIVLRILLFCSKGPSNKELVSNQPNKITGPNAGGSRQLRFRTPMSVRVGQF